MVPTVRDVVADRGLRLSVLSHEDLLDRPIRWVHATELVEPANYLEGGELLLTTGMRLGKAAPALRAYVDRLVAAGVVALGFGTGADLTHATVPKALVSACDKAGLPLLEVPEQTPFIQITKAVSDHLAADERERLARSLEAQRGLARASLSADRDSAVVARLAREIEGWVLLMGPRGEVVEASPTDAHTKAPSVRPEIDRLRPKGIHAGSSSSSGGQRVVIQPLGPLSSPGTTGPAARDARPRGYLVAAAPEPWSVALTSVVHTAVSLLSSTTHVAIDDSAARRGVRGAAASMALAGFADQLPLAALGWSALEHGPIAVYVMRGASGDIADAEKAIDDAITTAAVAVVDDDLVVVLEPGGAEEGALIGAVEELAITSDLHIGRALGEGFAEVSTVARRAKQAASAPGAVGGTVRDYADLAGVGLLDLVDADAAAGFSESTLAPIAAAAGGDDLLDSLEAWLSRHGQWDAAAKDLGVHRHTLRHRVRRIEQLLDRSMDDPAVRMDLWFALQQRRMP